MEKTTNDIAISIIVLAHNEEKHIEECLESIINQDFDKPYEIIVVNNESTDNTSSIVDKYSKKYSIIQHLKIPNYPQTPARLYGVKVAKGKYITFLDGDDLYLKNALSVLYKEIEKTQADMVNASLFYLRNNNKLEKNYFVKNKQMDRKTVLIAYMKDSYFHSFLWNKIYKRDLFKKAKFYYPDYIILFEDALMMASLILAAQKIISIKMPVTIYRKDNLGVTSAPKKSRYLDRLNTYAFLRWIIEQDYIEYLPMYRKYSFRRYIFTMTDLYLTKKAFSRKEYIVAKRNQKALLKFLNQKTLCIFPNTPFQDFFVAIGVFKIDS